MIPEIKTGTKNKRILLARLSSSLVERSRCVTHVYPSLPLKYIESILGTYDDIESKLIDGYIRKYSSQEWEQITRDYNPGILIIDISSYEFSNAVNYLKSVKKFMTSLVVIAIGRDPTVRFSCYLERADVFDIILPGEAEQEIPRVLNALNREERCEDLRKQYEEKFLKEGPFLVKDLDELPYPQYNEYEMKNYRFVYPIKMNKKIQWGYVLSSRGCPYTCTFCSPTIRKTYGKKVRLRKASKIVDEIEYLMNRYKVNVICFEDDNFTTVRAHIEGICHEILKRNLRIKWVAHARVDNLDYETLKLMKTAGCDLLRFGVESGSQKIIQQLKKTTGDNWVDQSRNTFRNARKLKIGTHALFMLGCPSETKEDMRKTFTLLKQLKPDFIQVHFFTPYPGCELYDTLKSSLNNINLDNMYHYARPLLNFSQIGTEKLKEWRCLFYREFLFSPRSLINHIYNYSFFYLWNPNIFCDLLKIRGHLQVE